jgi:hypothetical protein
MACIFNHIISIHPIVGNGGGDLASDGNVLTMLSPRI